MTKEETEAKIGRLTVEYTELRRQISLWDGELRQAGQRMAEKAPLFRLASGDPQRVLTALAEIPDKSDLVAIAQKLSKAVARQRDIKETLLACGVEMH